MTKKDTVRRQFDSSVTRVAPVFAILEQRTDAWVAKVLDLAARGLNAKHRPWIAEDMSPTLVDFAEKARGKRERGLRPPTSLLAWLLENVKNPDGRTLSTNPEVAQRRQRILDRDPETMAEALRALDQKGQSSAWSRFEGPTYPDVVIETPDALVIVEGKRTERGPTTHTTWMKGRHQMLRHLDAAWEIRGGRSVYGIFVVEADPNVETKVPERWIQAAAETLSDDVVKGSLPHRSTEEQASIAAAFIGITTWQAIVAEFGIDPGVIKNPDGTAGSQQSAR
jgi:hypothetical protein